MIWHNVRTCFTLLSAEDRRRWLRVIPLILVTSVSEAVGAAAVFVLVAAIADPAAAGRIPLIGAPLVSFSGNDPLRLGLLLLAAIGAFYLVKCVVVVASQYAQAVASARTAADLATRLLTAYLRAPYLFHLRRNASELVHATTHLAGITFGAVVAAMVHACAEILVVVAIAGILLLVAPGVTVLAIAVLVAVGVLLYRAMRRYSLHLGRLERDLDASTMRQQSQALSAIDEIAVLGRTEYFAREFADIAGRRAGVVAHQQLAQTLPRVLVETLFVAGVIVVTAALLATGASSSKTISLLGLFAYAGFRIIPSANRILFQAHLIASGDAGIERIRDDLAELESFATCTPARGDAAWKFSHCVEFAGASLDFDSGTPPVLQQVSLSLPRGRSLAVVGATGSGKSSLLRLLVGLLAPTAGRITVDGSPLDEVLAAWRRQLGFVPQEVHLIDDTMLRNIAIGIPAAAIDPDAVADCVARAQLREFVDSLPAGLDTRVGDRGVRLSGGERQRVGIARALYHRPDVLILDEATSALDPQTEAAVLNALRTEANGCTMIAVTHRLHAVRSFDRVAFMANGRLRAIGSFDELYSALPDFRRLAADDNGSETAARDADASNSEPFHSK